MTQLLAEYQGVLTRAGYPPDVVTLDFETFFDGTYGLSSLSTIEYIADSRFEVLGCAVHESQSLALNWYTDSAYLADLTNRYGPSLEGCTVMAQNSRFDLTILLKKYGILPRYHLDLVAVARHVHPQYSARLKDLAALYGLSPKGDTMYFKGCTRRTDRWARRGGRGEGQGYARPPAGHVGPAGT